METYEPGLTVDEAIAALEAIRLQHGGEMPLLMADGEPVRTFEYVPALGGPYNWPEGVYVNDMQPAAESA